MPCSHPSLTAFLIITNFYGRIYSITVVANLMARHEGRELSHYSMHFTSMARRTSQLLSKLCTNCWGVSPPDDPPTFYSYQPRFNWGWGDGVRFKSNGICKTLAPFCPLTPVLQPENTESRPMPTIPTNSNTHEARTVTGHACRLNDRAYTWPFNVVWCDWLISFFIAYCWRTKLTFGNCCASYDSTKKQKSPRIYFLHTGMGRPANDTFSCPHNTHSFTYFIMVFRRFREGSDWCVLRNCIVIKSTSCLSKSGWIPIVSPWKYNYYYKTLPEQIVK